MASQRIVIQRAKPGSFPKRPIKPEDIIRIIDSMPYDCTLKIHDYVSLKRYFLRTKIKFLSLSYIASLTGCICHRTVSDSVFQVTKQDKFKDAVLLIEKMLESFENRNSIT